MADRYGTGTIVERSPCRTEDEQRAAEWQEQIDSYEDAERQHAAYVREQAAHEPARACATVEG